MALLEQFIPLLAARAQWLAPLLLLGFLLGEMLARFCGFNALINRMHRLLTTLARKLNRSHRGAAKLVYRGMLLVGCALIPALLLGLALAQAQHHPWATLATDTLMIALYGRAAATFSLLDTWRRARRGALPLELPGGDFLFADTHAVLRTTIATRAEAFATGIVGTSIWYVLGGWPTTLAYLTLTALHRADNSPGFGWAARSLFRLMDALPRLLSLLLLTLAALFTPRTRPFAAARARSFTEALARLLHVSLGGPGPGGTAPWVGTGTAKLTAGHLLRWMVLSAIATFLLLLALMGQKLPNPLLLLD